MRPPQGGPPVTTAEVEVYDTVTGEWSTVAPMLSPRAFAAAEVLDGKLYVLGGFTISPGPVFEPVNSMEIYDPETDRWSEVPGLDDLRGGYALAAVDDHLYVAGGLIRDPATGDELLARVQRFDPEQCGRIPPGLADGAGEMNGLPHAIRRCPGSRRRGGATVDGLFNDLAIERRSDRRLEIVEELAGTIDVALEPLLSAHARAIADEADAEGDQATADAARRLARRLNEPGVVRQRE